MLRKIKKVYHDVENRADIIQQEVSDLNKKIDEINQKIVVMDGCIQDVIYANFFHDTIKNSKWFDKPLSLSGWAIGYNFAYVLYRTLDEIRPKKILELGLGQSTKIINEYANHFGGVEHHVVEHDSEWISFFERNTGMLKKSKVHLLECYKRKYKGVELNAYRGLKEELKNKKFDLIVIDGPIGSGKEYSRMDVLDLISDNIASQFVIMLDDCERIGEQGTISLIEKKLKDNKIDFSSSCTSYRGRTDVYICVSKDLDFLCHI